MKSIYRTILLTGLAVASVSACQKWTETQVLEPIKLTDLVKDDAYYEALRAYKQSDHSVAFGWFGNWTGTGASLENSRLGQSFRGKTGGSP